MAAATAIKTAGKRLIPLMNRVLIKKPDPPLQTDGGIVLPQNAKTKVLTGTVVAVGPGQRYESGQLVQVSIKPGDNVILPDYGGTRIQVEDGQIYYLYRESDILAKVDE